jgi:hypothetical protein
MKLIGLMGFAGCGKDTAAANMPGWRRVAFADKLKRDLISHSLAFYRVNPVDATPEQKALIRPILVAHGRIMREIKADWWIEALECDLRRFGLGVNAVVTDVRYPNECRWIHRLGGRVILISRPGIGPANEEEGGSIGAAVSAGLVDAVAKNDDTPGVLGAQVVRVAGLG